MPSISSLFHACLATLCLSTVAGAASATDGTALFETSIRPLFLDQCQKCHGEKKQEGGLRLDSKAGWQKGGDKGSPIKPGDASNSLLIKAVRRTDPKFQMPPKHALDAAQIAALEQWINAGAPDPRDGGAKANTTMADASKHWAYQPVGHPIPPPGSKELPIDRFLAANREKHGLQANPQADLRTLIRRASFDLTGLPPTPEEITAFLNDTAPDAFNRLIDRLMNTSAYGERWGRHWLDVARYADTAGDGADYPVREAIKYRDWVIQSINEDKPYNEFIREQIAGDILAAKAPPQKYAANVIATGFLAIGKRYGYKPSPDYQHLDFADAIDSVGRSLLGLSLGCARCHDHKYDPVTSADYYALYGIFQSSKWAFPGGEEQKRPSQFVPLIHPTEAARLDKQKAQNLERLEAALASLKQECAQLDGKGIAGGVDLGFEAQAIGKAPSTPWMSAGPNTVLAESQSPFNHVHPKGTRGVRVGSGKSNDGIRYVFASPLRKAAGKQMNFTVDFRTVAPATKTGAYRFFVGRGVVASIAIEVSVTPTEIAVRNGKNWDVVRKLQPGTWYTLGLALDPDQMLYSGYVGTVGDLTVFKDKALGSNWDGVIDTFICDGIGHVAGPAPKRDLDNIGLQVPAFAPPGSGPVTIPAQPANLAERIKKLDAEIAAATKERDAEATRDLYPVAYGVSEDKPVNARIQLRGEPDKLGDEVPRRFLQILGGDKLPTNETGSGRLELADWLTRPTNPLTARVFVNRVWQWHFGQGIVATPSDFGLRGEPPTHPELLDWLTSEFITSGWSLKALHRLIMQSHTYQLASDDHAANLRLDPANRWLWRYSRHSLDAESLRDAMLAVSGRLDRTVPGPHPFPPVQTWAFTIHRPFHESYDSDHRSVYLMLQRDRRHPYLSMFDGADPNQSVGQRMPTTTPTQTLFLMNSPFVQQQAEAFAVRLASLPGDDIARIKAAFETAQGRLPSPTEIEDAKAFLAAYQSKLERLSTPTDKQASLAWAGLAHVLLTSNGFLYVD